MSKSRVFILYSHGLFARGVQSLLSREAEVEVVGMEKEGPAALDRIKALRPDVILVDSGAEQEPACVTLSEILQEAPDARLVSLSLQENGIDVYDKHRVIASGPQDLVRVIRRESESQSGLRTED